MEQRRNASDKDHDGNDDEEDENENEDVETTPGTIEMDSIIARLGIEHQRCGAHTAQLAIKDGLNTSGVNTLIGSARNIVKEGRNTSDVDNYIRKHAKKTLIIDVETRWGSTYAMIDRLIELEEYVRATLGTSRNKLLDAQWKQLKELKELLKKAYEVTIKIQYSDCTPGYFYRKWSGLLIFYENHSSRLATDIANSMRRRQTELLKGDLLRAAIYIDVFNMELLSEEEEEDMAIQKIQDLVIVMSGLVADDQEQDTDNINLINLDQTNDTESDSDPEIAVLRRKSPAFETVHNYNRTVHHSNSDSDDGLPELDANIDIGAGTSSWLHRSQSNTSLTPIMKMKQEVKTALNELKLRRSELKKLKSKMKIDEVIRKEYPKLLQEVALLLTSMPMSQVSVERLFSALKIFKSDRGNRIKDDLLSAMLVLRANQ